MTKNTHQDVCPIINPARDTVLRRSEDGTAVLWLRDFSDGRPQIGPLGGKWQDVADYEEMGAILAEWDAAVNA